MYGREDLIEEIEGGNGEMTDKAQVLTEMQLELLRNAQQGQLRCPDCEELLGGEFVYLPGFFVGILLYCDGCMSTDALSAPARREQVERV
jgi:hypothetical protein